jgi:hypothetical protein
MNECIVQKNLENKQKDWLMPPNLKRKSLISDITGFTAGDGDHLLTFLTVSVLRT